MAWQTISGETPIDPSGLKVKGVVHRGQLNAAENANVHKATMKYLARKPSQRIAPFTLTWVKKLHQEMFGAVWAWAGKFRTRDGFNVGIPWIHIETSLHTMLENLACWVESGMGPLEIAARLHHESVRIHPFSNGNGRWSRMLANIWLKQNGHPETEWPDESVGPESVIRKDYIAAVKAADAGDFAPLLELHRKYTPTRKPPVTGRPPEPKAAKPKGRKGRPKRSRG